MRPSNIVQNLKSISRRFVFGRQEDSHEFLRYFIDALVGSCLKGLEKGLDPRTKETTLIHAIFGGYLRSEVKCLSCQYTSHTYESMLDLSVDIKNCISIEEALKRFVKPEQLIKGNMYKCERCKKKVNAEKRYNLHRTPNVLTLHLKRFDHLGGFGGKLGKFIEFGETLDVSSFISPDG
eukprot:Sdes_comp9021_c0_seq1m441